MGVVKSDIAIMFNKRDIKAFTMIRNDYLVSNINVAI